MALVVIAALAIPAVSVIGGFEEAAPQEFSAEQPIASGQVGQAASRAGQPADDLPVALDELPNVEDPAWVPSVTVDGTTSSTTSSSTSTEAVAESSTTTIGPVRGALVAGVPTTVPSGYRLTWSPNMGDFLSGQPFTNGVHVPYDEFFVFLAPQKASSVTWTSDNGSWVYRDDGYPWRVWPGGAQIWKMEPGQHVLTATVDGSVTISVRYTMGASLQGVLAANRLPTYPGSSAIATQSASAGTSTASQSSPPVTTTTTRPPVTTTTTRPPVSTVGGVAVFPGDSIQGLVNSHPGGTTFVIKAGVHRRQQVVPKDGDSFIGEPGAVLSGEGVTEFAFGEGGSGVTVRGLVIEKYASAAQKATVRPGGGAEGWVVEGNEIRYNGGIGLKAGSLWTVVGNHIHHNEQLGLAGAGGQIVVDGNEIAFNNTAHYDPYWEGGGTKFIHTNNLVVRNNVVHDNYGPGLWSDGNNRYTLYEGNRVYDNFGPGIFYEISHDGVIRNNVVERNGFGYEGWVDGAGILVATSPNVEVYGNTVRYNNDGIAGVHTDRSTSNSVYGPYALKNLWVHDNVIAMNVGQSGVVTNFDSAVFSAAYNNRFDNNTYTLGSASKYYRWQAGEITTSQWKATGNDAHSTW
jgi:parallel beta-helix repeat protein